MHMGGGHGRRHGPCHGRGHHHTPAKQQRKGVVAVVVSGRGVGRGGRGASYVCVCVARLRGWLWAARLAASEGAAWHLARLADRRRRRCMGRTGLKTPSQ